MFNTACESISIKDQVYQEKLAQLRAQLDALGSGTHAEFIQCKSVIQQELENRLYCNEVSFALQHERIESEYEAVLASIQKDFEEKKVYMKEALLNELEERKRQVDHEYQTMAVNGDISELKQQPKRNLRRRFNDASLSNDKKSRKASPTVNMLLSDAEIEDDVQNMFSSSVTVGDKSPSTLAACAINAVLGSFSPPEHHSSKKPDPDKDSKRCSDITSPERSSASSSAAAAATTTTMNEKQAHAKRQVYHLNGKLFYHKKWFLRGQPVHVCSNESENFNAVIHSVSSKEVSFRLVGDSANKKLNISVTHLQQGRYTLKKRVA